MNRILLLSAWMAALLLAVAVPAPAQLVELPGQPTEEPEAEPWIAPDPTSLGSDWWLAYDLEDPQAFREQADQTIESLQARIQGLDAANLVAAQTLLNALKSNLDLLHAALGQNTTVALEPLPVQERYTLDGLLEIRARERSLEDRLRLIQTEISQIQRRTELSQARRDTLMRQYNAADPQSPARLTIGIDRMLLRSERAISEQQQRLRREQLRQYEQRLDEVSQVARYARDHLDRAVPEDTAFDAALAEVGERIAELAGRRGALQQQLLDSVGDQDTGIFQQLLLRQQVTQAAAQEALAVVRQRLALTQRDWYRLHAEELDPGYSVREATAETRALVDQTAAQLELWGDASQNTLITPPPPERRGAAREAFDSAQAAAQETLRTVEEIRDVSDDLLTVQGLLADDLVHLERGFRGWWTRVALVAGSAWDRVRAVMSYTLFSIGEAPVTPGGITMLVLILATGYAMSWFIRQLLSRLEKRRQFAQSGSIYTLGRILHYVIITVALLVALGSMGLDFSNIALIAGALSVGIGFGLQSIVNNFVSGLILLFEGSLRVGDYIELDSGVTGIVKEISTRSTRINTNDNLDVVVPNSELVSNRLTNWTLRESIARMRIPFGVAYGSDKDKVRQAALEAAEGVEFTLRNAPGRDPEVWLVNFGDSSLDFELLVWVSRQGVRRPQRVRATYLWALETKLREHGIEIPFPQRDLHLRSGFPPGPETKPSTESES